MATIRKIAEAEFPTLWGKFCLLGFEGNGAGEGRVETAVALVMGDIHSRSRSASVHHLKTSPTGAWRRRRISIMPGPLT